MSEPMDTREEVELPELSEIARRNIATFPDEPPDYYYAYCQRNTELKSSLAANREQKAEIERFLTQAHNAEGNAVFQQRKAEAAEARIRELALMFGVPDGGRYLNDWIARSEKLRASVGEKWIEIVRDYRNNHVGCAIRTAGLLHGSKIDDRCITCIQADELLAPPTLPGEEK